MLCNGEVLYILKRNNSHLEKQGTQSTVGTEKLNPLTYLSTADTSGKHYKTKPASMQLSTQSYHQSVLPPAVSLQCLFYLSLCYEVPVSSNTVA